MLPANPPYPALPFPDHSWRLSHHTGVLTPKLLQALLFAASTYAGIDDSAQYINNYIVSNGLLPSNVREDSRQADVWRDYQQMLSELGLIFSTRTRGQIRLTQAGLAFLDGGISFTDLLTIQTFRWQYPNGHNTQRSAGDPSSDNFATQQTRSGILIRPAALVWRVLDELHLRGQEITLSAVEIENFLIPARTNADVDLAVQSLARYRTQNLRLPSSSSKGRNASDWIKRLSHTHTFQSNASGKVCFSRFSEENREPLRQVISDLSNPEKFWIPPANTPEGPSWYLWYGSLDANDYPLPAAKDPEDFGHGPEPAEEADSAEARDIDLRPYEGVQPPVREGVETISSVYSAELSDSAHRLHDSMVKLIASRCESKRAKVYFDPATVDLLVQYEGRELLIEVKSATSSSMTQKLRTALGQVIHYDYLRSLRSDTPRRKAIGLALDIPAPHWSKAFLCDYLDMDLLTLRQGQISVFSNDNVVSRLFA